MRPQLSVLSAAEKEGLVEAALQALAEVGVLIENAAALELLASAGVRQREGRVFPDEAQVRAALDSAPAEVKLYARDVAANDDAPLVVGGDAVCFDPGSSALKILDAETRRQRPATLADCERFAWVTEACQHIGAQSTALVPSDAPAPLSDSLRLYVALKGCVKPVITGTFGKAGFAVMRDLLVAVRGGEQALRERPLAIFDCAPTPPFKWSDLTTQALLDCARAGIPVAIVSMPMAGATAPVTLRDAVAQHCAETLCGLVMHQLAAPGAPVIYGGSPAALDMRHGTPPMGAMETMLLDLANAEVAKHLGLPTQAYMALSDAKLVDWQAGMESSAGAVLAALAGINMVSGPGMLDYENCQSPEKLLLDNELCGMALRLRRGVGPGADERLSLFAALVQRGELLGHRHTRQTFRQQILLPGKLIERASYDDWAGRGAPDAFTAAAAEVARLVAAGNPQPVSTALERSLREIMLAEAQRLGVGERVARLLAG